MIHEITAQFEKFKQCTGSVPTHVDGHQHIHVLPGVRKELISVMVQNGVFFTRVPAELKLSDCKWIDEQQRAFYVSVVRDAIDSKDLFKASKIRLVLFHNIEHCLFSTIKDVIFNLSQGTFCSMN